MDKPTRGVAYKPERDLSAATTHVAPAPTGLGALRLLDVDLGSGTNRTAAAAAIIGAIVVLAVVALVLKLGPFAEEELSAAEFVSQADEICSKAHDEFVDLQSNTPRTAEDAADLMDSLIGVATEERDAIADLGAPPSLDEQVTRYLAGRDRGIEVLRDGLEAARDEDSEAYEAAQARLANTQPQRARSAKGIGFKECSTPLEGA